MLILSAPCATFRQLLWCTPISEFQPHFFVDFGMEYKASFTSDYRTFKRSYNFTLTVIVKTCALHKVVRRPITEINP